MAWVRVTKTVKGRPYAYLQRSFRDGAHVRTESRYLGPANGTDRPGGVSVPEGAVSTDTAEDSPPSRRLVGITARDRLRFRFSPAARHLSPERMQREYHRVLEWAQGVGVPPEGFPRISYVYALTAEGAAIIAERLGPEVSAPLYPAGGIQFVNDFLHREAYVDFCIALWQWTETGEFRHCRSMTHYFDKTGSNRRGVPAYSLNRLELPKGRAPFVPDGLALIDTGAKRRALAVEIHHRTDTKRAVEKLVELTHALSAGVIERHLGHDKAAFVLSVATSPELNATIRKRMATVSGIDRFAPLFLFNDLQTIMREGFDKGWTHCDGTAAGVFG